MRNVAMRNRESEGHTDSAVEDSARAGVDESWRVLARLKRIERGAESRLQE